MAEFHTSQGPELVREISLAEYTVIEICLCLSPKDAISLALTCRSFYKTITTSHRLWKSFCYRVWLCSGSSPQEDSWHSEFVSWSRSWGPYQEVYAAVRRAWDLVYLKLQQSGQNPDLIFRPGADESLLRATEERLGVSLPIDYKCFLRIHNGQFESPPSAVPRSFFGTRLHFYHFEDGESLLEAAEKLEVMLKVFVPLCHPGNLQSYFISVKRGVKPEEFEFGSVQCASKAQPTDDPTQIGIFIHTLAPTFEKWFTRFASEMQIFPLVSGVLQRYPYPAACVATTRGITIRVGTAFSNMHSRSIPGMFLVIYHVTISMSHSENPALASQLTTRHWIITDDEGKQETVDGEGVVGYTPEVGPGTVFTYTSGSHISGEWSLMEGHFSFRNLLTGETFDAKVPQFRLEVPPYTTYNYKLSEML